MKNTRMMIGKGYAFEPIIGYRAFLTYSYVGFAMTLWVTDYDIPTKIGGIVMKFSRGYFIGNDHCLPQI